MAAEQVARLTPQAAMVDLAVVVAVVIPVVLGLAERLRLVIAAAAVTMQPMRELPVEVVVLGRKAPMQPARFPAMVEPGRRLRSRELP
jgi:hypothetical protein